MNVMPTKYFKNFTILKYFYSIFVLYAKLEEEHGLGRHALAVYDRAIDAVEPSERFGLFNIYLKKAAEIYGITRTRQIYQKAIEVLGDMEAKEMCLRYKLLLSFSV